MSYTKLKQQMAERGFEVSEGIQMTAQDQALARDFFYVTGKKMEDFVDIMGRPVDLSNPENFEPEGDDETGEGAEVIEAGEIEDIAETFEPVQIEGTPAPMLTTEEAASLGIEQAPEEKPSEEVAEAPQGEEVKAEELKAEEAQPEEVKTEVAEEQTSQE